MNHKKSKEKIWTFKEIASEKNKEGQQKTAEEIRLARWIKKEITSREYTQKEIETIIYLTKQGKQETAWKILLKGHKCPITCQHCQITNFIHRELDNKQKTKEEKIQAIVSFSLNQLSQGVKEEWQKRRIKAELLTILAEHETKIMKREMFKSYIDQEIIKKMEF